VKAILRPESLVLNSFLYFLIKLGDDEIWFIQFNLRIIFLHLKARTLTFHSNFSFNLIVRTLHFRLLLLILDDSSLSLYGWKLA